ncbi:hypothetical protein IWW36_005046 [Coemansia brasiliensis]|uniref:Uncharacterized protein n=1 Tax=Coemansia brasiliensis TaxID=2650707 RepID=A0A9W8LVR0_9FUNG|nr:hypothetical protein IWW36_005046 [Coemansia brasiliensis]
MVYSDNIHMANIPQAAGNPAISDNSYTPQKYPEADQPTRVVLFDQDREQLRGGFYFNYGA